MGESADYQEKHVGPKSNEDRYKQKAIVPPLFPPQAVSLNFPAAWGRQALTEWMVLVDNQGQSDPLAESRRLRFEGESQLNLGEPTALPRACVS